MSIRRAGAASLAAAVAAALALTVAVGATADRPSPPPRATGRPLAAVAGGPPSGPPLSGRGCITTVDDTDPLAVAQAVATWCYSGAGPAGVVSPHGWQVVAGRPKATPTHSAAAVTSLVLLDPRAAPVVVYAVVRDPGPHRLVLTLFPRPSGGWAVDDVAVLDG